MIEKLKIWAKTKLLPWAKKNWMTIVNFFVLWILYSALPEDSGLGALVGLWIFVQIGVLGWKLFKKAEA
jgi:hypothetical protein